MSSEEEVPEGNIQGKCTLVIGVPSSRSQQASTDHGGGLYLQCHDPVQHNQLLCRPGKKTNFASLEIIVVHHAKSSVYDN